MAFTYRVGLGRNLTAAEVDANFDTKQATLVGSPYIQPRPSINLATGYGVSTSNTGAANSALIATAVAYAQANGRPLYLPGQTAGWENGAYPIDQDVDLSAGNIVLLGDRGWSGLKQTVKAQHVLTIGAFNLTIEGVNGFHQTSDTVDTSMGHGIVVQGMTQGAHLKDMFMWRHNKGFSAPVGAAFFSSNVTNLSLKWLASSAVEHFDGTGNHWSNIYCGNDEFGNVASDAAPVNLGQTEDEFSQLNIEGFVANTLIRSGGANTKIGTLHIERARMAGFNPCYLIAIAGKLLVDNMIISYGDHGYTGSTGNTQVVFADWAAQVDINGLSMPSVGDGVNVNTTSRPFKFFEGGGTGVSRVCINNADLIGIDTEPTGIAQLVNINDARYGIQTIAYAATIAPDLALAVGDQGVNIGALTGAITINAPTNLPPKGKEIVIYLLQDGTGSRTPTWNAAWKLASLTGSGTANQKAQVTFRSDGANLVQVASTGWYS